MVFIADSPVLKWKRVVKKKLNSCPISVPPYDREIFDRECTFDAPAAVADGRSKKATGQDGSTATCNQAGALVQRS